MVKDRFDVALARPRTVRARLEHLARVGHLQVIEDGRALRTQQWRRRLKFWLMCTLNMTESMDVATHMGATVRGDHEVAVAAPREALRREKHVSPFASRRWRPGLKRRKSARSVCSETLVSRGSGYSHYKADGRDVHALQLADDARKPSRSSGTIDLTRQGPP